MQALELQDPPRKPQDIPKILDKLRQQCDENNAKSCFLLGEFYRTRMGVEIDYSKAVLLYEKACALGYAQACTNLGVLYDEGDKIPQDYAKAALFYGKACELGHIKSCTNLGYLYSNGLGVERDFAKANVLYEKACELGDGIACHNLGLYHIYAQGKEKDYVKAAKFFYKACELDYHEAGNYLEWIYFEGLGIEKIEKASELDSAFKPPNKSQAAEQTPPSQPAAQGKSRRKMKFAFLALIIAYTVIVTLAGLIIIALEPDV